MAAARRTTTTAKAEEVVEAQPETPQAEKITASAGVPEGGSLARTIGDVLEALAAQGADLASGVTVTVDGTTVNAVGEKVAE